MNDLVSIIIPSYNTANYVVDSIQSVLAQTYMNWELIIIDDCSTDNTDEIITPFLVDPRIRYLKNEKNYGAALSRNRALREAKGKWIAFLDSDDLWLPEKLEKQISFMEKNGYKFTFTDYRMIMQDGTPTKYIYTAPKKVTNFMLYLYCWFSTITVIYDREAIGLIQIVDIKKNNDYAMWLLASEKVDCYRLPECLSVYCKREKSISSGNKFRLVKHHYIMFYKALNKDKVSAFVLTGVNLIFGVFRKMFLKKHVS